MAAKRTGFDKFVDAQMRDPQFARAYRKARREIDAVDRIVRALDEARIDLGMTKAAAATSCSVKPKRAAA